MGIGTSIGFMAALGGLSGVGLALCSRWFAVEVDPRVQELKDLLPGANCAACGFPGCAGYAQAMAKGLAPCNLCPPGGQATAERLAAKLGAGAQSVERMVAVVRCQGTEARCASDARYLGIPSCRAAHLVAGGAKKCPSGCLGFGDCVKSCTFGAMRMSPEGLPVVEAAKCTACGRCVATCPRAIMALEPVRQKTSVLCRNTQKGAVANKACATACIACKKCEKACPFDAVHVQNNLAVIDAAKCRNCGRCAAACPKSCILDGAAGSRPRAYVQETCNGCGTCVEACPEAALSGAKGARHEVNPVKCTGCAACVEKCPSRSIILRDTK